jgi:Na+-transporting methylmalonyl-CoA/oxaloacetate decarboxylase gamma subunit
MEGLQDIAQTGAPLIVTAVGMGTVFLCLAVLYTATHVLGWFMVRRQAPAATEPAQASAAEGEATSSTPADSAGENAALVAAMTLVLVRHRASLHRSAEDDTPGTAPWKLAGRLRMLRS